MTAGLGASEECMVVHGYREGSEWAEQQGEVVLWN